jgi:hypothetical protein
VALIVALAEDPREKLVRRHHAEWAMELVWFVVSNMVVMVRERVANSEFHAMVKEGYTAIRNAGEQGLTHYELRRHVAFSKLRKRDRDDVLESLTGAGRIALMEIRTKGRKRTAFVAVELCDDE